MNQISYPVDDEGLEVEDYSPRQTEEMKPSYNRSKSRFELYNW
jgi:hypothetical protein